MEQTTNQQPHHKTIELFINQIKARKTLGELIFNYFKIVQEALQTQDPELLAQLRTINGSLETILNRELQTLKENRLTAVAWRQRMRDVLLSMEEKKLIRWKYDYAWIYLTILLHKDFPVTYDSTDAFLGDLQELGLLRVPTRTLFERMLKVVNGDDIESWTVSDNMSTSEGKRRRGVAQVFLQRMMLF